MNDVCDKFKEVCHIFNISAVELSDVKICGKLFQAKGLNDEKCTGLLMVRGQLKPMRGFENLYIQKVLTFHQ